LPLLKTELIGGELGVVKPLKRLWIQLSYFAAKNKGFLKDKPDLPECPIRQAFGERQAIAYRTHYLDRRS
jgi:hypothetical protein